MKSTQTKEQENKKKLMFFWTLKWFPFSHGKWMRITDAWTRPGNRVVVSILDQCFPIRTGGNECMNDELLLLLPLKPYYMHAVDGKWLIFDRMTIDSDKPLYY